MGRHLHTRGRADDPPLAVSGHLGRTGWTGGYRLSCSPVHGADQRSGRAQAGKPAGSRGIAMSMEGAQRWMYSEALQRRRTVRAFLERPVPRETLETILEACPPHPLLGQYPALGDLRGGRRGAGAHPRHLRRAHPGQGARPRPTWRCRAAGPRSAAPAPRRSPRAERAWPARPRTTRPSSTPLWRPTAASSTPPAWSICAWTGGSGTGRSTTWVLCRRASCWRRWSKGWIRPWPSTWSSTRT